MNFTIRYNQRNACIYEKTRDKAHETTNKCDITVQLLLAKMCFHVRDGVNNHTHFYFVPASRIFLIPKRHQAQPYFIFSVSCLRKSSRTEIIQFLCSRTYLSCHYPCVHESLSMQLLVMNSINQHHLLSQTPMFGNPS